MAGNKIERFVLQLLLLKQKEVEPLFIIMRLLAADPRRTAGVLFPSRYLSENILISDPVFDDVDWLSQ